MSNNVVSYSDFNKIKDKKIKISHMINNVKPLNENMKKLIKNFDDGKFIVALGYAGTGKTYSIFVKCLEEVLKRDGFRKIVIIRSAVPVRDLGFMPGDKTEKTMDYEKTYASICSEVFGFEDDEDMLIYQKLKSEGLIEFRSTSFNQGVTINDALIIVDEAQNLNFSELYNSSTRVGKNSRIYFCGDYLHQDFLSTTKNKDDNSGFKKVIDIINHSKVLSERFSIISFEEEDIVRSGFVKDFIISHISYEKEVNNVDISYNSIEKKV